MKSQHEVPARPQPSDKKIDVVKIHIQIGEVELHLSPEECINLKEVLMRLYPTPHVTVPGTVLPPIVYPQIIGPGIVSPEPNPYTPSFEITCGNCTGTVIGPGKVEL